MSTSNVVKTPFDFVKDILHEKISFMSFSQFHSFHITCHMKIQVTLLLNKIQATFTNTILNATFWIYDSIVTIRIWHHPNFLVFRRYPLF